MRIDVLAERTGPSHCGWEDTPVLITADPFGSRGADSTSDVEYVRDPNGLCGIAEFVDGFETPDSRPVDATDTGYRQGQRELWLSPSDPDAIYINDADTVERWPRAEVPGCSQADVAHVLLCNDTRMTPETTRCASRFRAFPPRYVVESASCVTGPWSSRATSRWSAPTMTRRWACAQASDITGVPTSHSARHDPVSRSQIRTVQSQLPVTIPGTFVPSAAVTIADTLLA